MKKVFQSEKYIRHSQRKTRRVLKKRRSRRQSSGFRTSVRATRRAHHNVMRDCVAPEHLSIIDNPEETLSFFEQVYSLLRQEYSVTLRLESVNTITPDAILYMLSVLHMFNRRQGLRIAGTAPKDEYCRHIFTESGFYNYVTSDYTPKRNEKDILEVKSSELVLGKIALSVVQFANEKLARAIPVLVRRQVYSTILECMGNTREHAYTGNEEYHPKWWLMAVHSEKNNSVRFAILDNGQTIPRTVKRKILERMFAPDNVLIKSALLGKFRTRTNDHWRGKGLPKILNTYQNGAIQDLSIVSNRGYVHYASNEFRELNQKFIGTLVVWTINKGIN